MIAQKNVTYLKKNKDEKSQGKSEKKIKYSDRNNETK